MFVFNGLLLLVNVRAYRWLARVFRRKERWRRAVAWALGGSLALTIAGRLVSRAGYNPPVEQLLVAAFAVQLTALVSVLILLSVDVGSLVARILRATGRLVAPEKAAEPEVENRGLPEAPETVEAPRLSRREFTLEAVVGTTFVLGGSSSLYGSLVERHDYVVEEVPVALPGLARAFDGFSIVQLSDLHLGQFVGPPELRRAEALVRKARPDLIVLTGDLLDHDARYAELLGHFVRRLVPLAREGVSVCSGNHDFYAGIVPIVRALEAAGARVLRNQGVVIGGAGAGFSLLGVEDVYAHRFSPELGPDLSRAIASLPALGGRVSPARDLPRILLSHNPVFFEQAQGQVALQLSGHTHGGQFNPLVRPAEWLLPHGWIAGMYSESGSKLYVNRGFGTAGPPARLGAPPEVSRFVLTSG